MPKLTPPSLPPGPRQALSGELHRLHRRAGWPSVRDLARALGAGVASSSRIHDAFTKPRLPAWGLVQVLVTALSERIPRADPGAESERFHALWEAAAEASAESADVPEASAGRDLQPPPLFLSPPAVPLAGTAVEATGTSIETEAHLVSREHYEKLLRIGDYLKASRKGENLNFSRSNIIGDMTSVILDETAETLSVLRQVREGIEYRRNQVISSDQANLLSARLAELKDLEAAVEHIFDRSFEIESPVEFEELRNLLYVNNAILSTRFIRLALP